MEEVAAELEPRDVSIKSKNGSFGEVIPPENSAERAELVEVIVKEPLIDAELDLALDLQNWMGNLPEQLRKIAIIHLAIPGTHDSGTYDITSQSQLAPDAESWLKKLQWLGPILTSVMSRWSKTQDYIIRDQLVSGIRFFDLRMATKPKDTLHIVHALYSVPVDHVLDDMKSFLDKHPREHFYDMSVDNHIDLIAKIQNKFGKAIVPLLQRTYMQHLNLDYLNENHYQVLIIYRWNNPNPFYPSQSYPTPWPNTTSTTKLLKILDDGLSNRNNDFGYVSQFILTPDGVSIFKNLLCGNTKTFSAIPLYTTKLDWVQKQRPGRGGVNVIIGDFVDIEALVFTRTVINLNKKIMTSPTKSGHYEELGNSNGLPLVTE